MAIEGNETLHGRNLPLSSNDGETDDDDDDEDTPVLPIVLTSLGLVFVSIVIVMIWIYGRKKLRNSDIELQWSRNLSLDKV